MIKLLKYNLNSEFDSNKESLNQLDNYVALTEDNQTVHLKPLPNILVITTNNTRATIYKRTDNQNGHETVTLENGENKLTDWNYGFYFDYTMNTRPITSFDLSKYNTSNITNMDMMFSNCSGLTSLDLSNFDTSKVTDMMYMFDYCTGLTYIKCKQAFKDWCWLQQNTIKLPTAMREGGSGKWEIVDVQDS